MHFSARTFVLVIPVFVLAFLTAQSSPAAQTPIPSSGRDALMKDCTEDYYDVAKSAKLVRSLRVKRGYMDYTAGEINMEETAVRRVCGEYLLGLYPEEAKSLGKRRAMMRQLFAEITAKQIAEADPEYRKLFEKDPPRPPEKIDVRCKNYASLGERIQDIYGEVGLSYNQNFTIPGTGASLQNPYVTEYFVVTLSPAKRQPQGFESFTAYPVYDPNTRKIPALRIRVPRISLTSVPYHRSNNPLVDYQVTLYRDGKALGTSQLHFEMNKRGIAPEGFEYGKQAEVQFSLPAPSKGPSKFTVEVRYSLDPSTVPINGAEFSLDIREMETIMSRLVAEMDPLVMGTRFDAWDSNARMMDRYGQRDNKLCQYFQYTK